MVTPFGFPDSPEDTRGNHFFQGRFLIFQMPIGVPVEAKSFLQLIHPENTASELKCFSEVNWDDLLKIARNHALVPVFNRALSRLDSSQVPQQIRDECR